MLVETPQIGKARQAIIEAGHCYLFPEYYLNQEKPVMEDELLGAMIGNEVQKLMRSSMPVSLMLFIDDFHGRDGNDSQEVKSRYDEVMTEYTHLYGFVPDEVVFENDKINAAAHLYGRLVQKGVIRSGEGKLKHGERKVRLTNRYRDGSLLPTCSLIDTALYLEKMDRDTLAITILPEMFRSEQEEVRTILDAYGMSHPNIVVYYFTLNPVAVTMEDWRE